MNPPMGLTDFDCDTILHNMGVVLTATSKKTGRRCIRAAYARGRADQKKRDAEIARMLPYGHDDAHTEEMLEDYGKRIALAIERADGE